MAKDMKTIRVPTSARDRLVTHARQRGMSISARRGILLPGSAATTDCSADLARRPRTAVTGARVAARGQRVQPPLHESCWFMSLLTGTIVVIAQMAGVSWRIEEP